MGNIKSQIIEFYKRENSVQFSKNLWMNLLGHALIGLTVGVVMFVIRGTNSMLTILFPMIVTTLWGLRSHLKKKD